MSKDELIVKQQIEIEEYKKIMEINKDIKDEIEGCFYNIGEPLNDNVLMFNKKQKQWAHSVVNLVENLETSIEFDE